MLFFSFVGLGADMLLAFGLFLLGVWTSTYIYLPPLTLRSIQELEKYISKILQITRKLRMLLVTHKTVFQMLSVLYRVRLCMENQDSLS